jgi:hypothetical protein
MFMDVGHGLEPDEYLMVGFMFNIVIEDEVTELAKEQYLAAKSGSGNHRQGLMAAQLMLTSSSLVSKALWNPPADKYASPEDHRRAVEYRARMRKALQIKGARWQTLESRAVRNMFEHIDIELEKYAAENPPLPYKSNLIGQYEMRFRMFDPKHQMFAIIGEDTVGVRQDR